MSDHKILELFRSGRREKAFAKLYHLYPRIEKLILSKGGNKDDARDVFQEALIILNRNLEKTDFKLTSSFYTYLYSVSRFVWKDTQTKFKKNQLKELNGDEVEMFQAVIEEKKYKLAENAFSKIGKRCQQLLQLFYHQRMSFKDISEKMKFSSEKVAKNQKYKCLKKAKDIYQQTLKTVQP